MKVSLFCASIRPQNWPTLLESLKSTKLEYEVIMCGFIDESILIETEGYKELKYIQTKDKDGNPCDIKPAQAYEVARRACSGDLVGWISDDFQFPEGALDRIYEFWANECMGNEKTIVAPKIVDPEANNNDMNDKRFYSRNLNTPQMAQCGFMSRKYLQELGGIDRRYVYGKWDYDICMRVYADGGKVVRYEDIEIKVEHGMKNEEVTNDWSGVNEDSETCENSWVIGGYKGIPQGLLLMQTVGQYPMVFYPISNNEVTLKRLDAFEPYTFSDEEMLTKSESIKTRWM